MRTVLLVESEGPFRRAAIRALRSRGHRVVEAAGASEADRLLGAVEPDLMIVAHALAETTGAAWIEKRRRVGCRTPALLRGPSDAGFAPKLLGATQLLRNPLLAEELAVRVEFFLALGLDDKLTAGE